MTSKFRIIAKRKLKEFFSNRGVVTLSKVRYDSARSALSRAVISLAKSDNIRRASGVTGVVFSKDRPLQLHGLLKSYFKLVNNPPELAILFSASTPDYRSAYLEVQTLYSEYKIKFIEEDGFRNTLVACLEQLSTDRVFFLVDDILFIRPVDFSDLLEFGANSAVPSLRMAPHLSYCYTQMENQAVPEMKNVGLTKDGEKLFSWKWKDGELDWAYALSVDGHLFSTGEILAMSRLVDFVAPNTYESALQWFSDLYSERSGICYEQSRIVNIPFNKVQNENQNIAGDISSGQMLAYWSDGLEIDDDRYMNIINQSAHQEMELFLKKR